MRSNQSNNGIARGVPGRFRPSIWTRPRLEERNWINRHSPGRRLGTSMKTFWSIEGGRRRSSSRCWLKSWNRGRRKGVRFSRRSIRRISLAARGTSLREPPRALEWSAIRPSILITKAKTLKELILKLFSNLIPFLKTYTKWLNNAISGTSTAWSRPKTMKGKGWGSNARSSQIWTKPKL